MRGPQLFILVILGTVVPLALGAQQWSCFASTTYGSWSFANIPRLNFTNAAGQTFAIGLCGISTPQCLDGSTMICETDRTGSRPIAYTGSATITTMGATTLNITATGYMGRRTTIFVTADPTQQYHTIKNAYEEYPGHWVVNITAGAGVFQCLSMIDSCGVCGGDGSSCNGIPCLYNDTIHKTTWNFTNLPVLTFQNEGGEVYSVGMCKWLGTLQCADGSTVVCEADRTGSRPVAYRASAFIRPLQQNFLMITAGGYNGRKSTIYVTYDETEKGAGHVAFASSLNTNPTNQFVLYLSVGDSVFSCMNNTEVRGRCGMPNN